jgi:hypothetical protein
MASRTDENMENNQKQTQPKKKLKLEVKSLSDKTETAVRAGSCGGGAVSAAVAAASCY